MPCVRTAVTLLVALAVAGSCQASLERRAARARTIADKILRTNGTSAAEGRNCSAYNGECAKCDRECGGWYCPHSATCYGGMQACFSACGATCLGQQWECPGGNCRLFDGDCVPCTAAPVDGCGGHYCNATAKCFKHAAACTAACHGSPCIDAPTHCPQQCTFDNNDCDACTSLNGTCIGVFCKQEGPIGNCFRSWAHCRQECTYGTCVGAGGCASRAP